MTVPFFRPRRLRISERMRSMVRETRLTSADFIYPLFVVPGSNIKNEIPSLPGICHL
jgi:porphobilinogen synthase